MRSSVFTSVSEASSVLTVVLPLKLTPLMLGLAGIVSSSPRSVAPERSSVTGFSKFNFSRPSKLVTPSGIVIFSADSSSSRASSGRFAM